MMGEKNGHNPEASQDLSQMSSSNPLNDDIQSMIGPAIHQTVNQYHGLLRQGLEQEVMRIIQEFEAATSDIESTIAKRVKARMGELVQQEVRRIFDNALSNVEGSFGDPFLGLEGSSSQQSSSPPNRPRPQASRATPNNSPIEPEAFDDGPENWGGDGGSKVEPSPAPSGPSRRPPSLWTMPTLEDQDEPIQTEAVAEAAQPQMAQDPNLFQNWDDEEVDLAENDEPEPVVDTGDEIYEGTVRLNVEANGHIREVVHFVRELRQAPQLRLLRMVGNNKEGVEIWLGLREPLALRKMLPEIAGIAVESKPIISSQSDKEQRLMVRLVPGKSTGESQEYPWLEDSEAKQVIA